MGRCSVTASAVIALITEVLANLPAIVRTGEQVIQLINDAYEQIKEAVDDRDVTPEEIRELVAKINGLLGDVGSLPTRGCE